MKQQPVTVTSVPSFETLHAKMQPHFRYFTRRILRLRGDDFDDAMQELTLLAYELYHSAVRLGRKVFYTPIMKYAIGRFKEGRRFNGSNSVDVLSERTRQLGRVDVCMEKSLPFLLGKYDVARTVDFKLDFSDWYHRQSTRDQQIIHDLAMSETTNAVAKKFGVTAGAISIKRRTFEKSWHNFINPPPDNDSAVVKK